MGRAARGGKDRKYPWGNDEPTKDRLNTYLQVKGDWQGMGHPTPVGVYPRGLSPEGIADMADNVWEWCADAYAAYAPKEVSNPTGPTESKEVRRVVRGGSWYGSPWNCRVSYRDHDGPTVRLQSTDFRVVWGLFGQDSSRKP